MAEATLHGDHRASHALQEFYLRYHQPVISLLRLRGVVENRVEDMAHDFFLQLMETSALKRADPALGRFRCYLQGAMKRFLSDDVRRNQAGKRGGGSEHIRFDSADSSFGELSADDAHTSLLLDREWALHLFTRALDATAQGWSRGEKAARFAVLRAFLPGATESISQQEATSRLGLSEAAFRTDLSRLRTAFRKAVRDEVAATVNSPQEVDGELQHLFAVLQAAPAFSEKTLPQTAAVS